MAGIPISLFIAVAVGIGVGGWFHMQQSALSDSVPRLGNCVGRPYCGCDIAQNTQAAGQAWTAGHHADFTFEGAAKNGVQSRHWQFGNMPPAEDLTRADIMSIVAFIREVQRESRII